MAFPPKKKNIWPRGYGYTSFNPRGFHVDFGLKYTQHIAWQ